MASLAGNRHHDRVNERVILQSAAGVDTLLDLRGWLARGEDGTSTGTRSEPFGAVRITDANLVPGTDLAPASNGWSHWNATAPSGTLARVACPAGACLRYSPGGSAGLVSSPYFSVEAGRSYRLSVDVEVGQATAVPRLIIRRGSGGATPYAALVEEPAAVTVASGWQRIVVVFRVTQTVRVNDPVTGDRGARVDLENLGGGAVMLANLDLRPVAWAEAQTVLLANPSAVPARWSCDTASLGVACGQFVRLSDGAAVLWPLALGPHGAAILYRNDPLMADADRDGIADVDDRCPATAAGAPVDGAGCPPSF
jgi:hypothetical protein